MRRLEGYERSMIPNFSFVIAGQLAASAHPGYGVELRDNLAWLYEQDVRAILTLTTAKLPEAVIRECGFRSLHLPVTDFTPPTLEQIAEGVAFIRQNIEVEHEAVLVHCGSGYGRTGTMLACYFVRLGSSAEEAIEKVRQMRPGSIETKAQEEIIASYARSLSDESSN